MDDTRSIFSRLADALEGSWAANARPEQLPPPGEWSVWLVLAGRGFGKTWTGANWVHATAMRSGCRIALVGPTAADVRDTMVEGESGILSICPDFERPTYEPSKRRLTWPNGSMATMFSAEEPSRLRGPQHGFAWVDELAAMQNMQETWAQLMFGMRLGQRPRTLITTTPKPSKLLKEIMGREGKDVVITRGSTYDNRANLPESFLSEIISKFEGTRLGRQELNAELLTDTPGALWQMDWIDGARVQKAPDLRRVVVAIDPAVSLGEDSDETGIVVAGLASDGHVYVLQDLSGRFAPHEWARRAIAAFDEHKADRIIGEANNGGLLIRHTLETLRPTISYRAVHASRGKVTRAEPISALYEQRKVHHVGGGLSALEDQMCAFTANQERRPGESPDRVDALVWAITELAVDARPATATSLPFEWR
jgi:predicted phage terminase large subunit-like protein